MGTPALFGLFVGWVLVWAACAAACGRLCARLGLDGLEPPGACDRELVVRRALRRLLTFNCWVIWPLGIPSTIVIMLILEKDGPVTLGSSKPALGILAFTVAVPMLVRQMRRFERERTAPTGVAVPRSFWIEGP